MWDSVVTPWNAMTMGPKRDLTGELAKAFPAGSHWSSPPSFVGGPLRPSEHDEEQDHCLLDNDRWIDHRQFGRLRFRKTASSDAQRPGEGEEEITNGVFMERTHLF